LEGLDNGVHDVPIGFKGRIREAGVVQVGAAESFKEGIIVAAKLYFDIRVHAAEPEEVVKETQD
jgi:hypothetical protein